MPINTIQNNTGAVLDLFDVQQPLGSIPAGGALQQVPITITQVTRAGVNFPNKNGGFLNGVSYAATYVAGGGGNPNSVVFTGPNNVVTFTT